MSDTSWDEDVIFARLYGVRIAALSTIVARDLESDLSRLDIAEIILESGARMPHPALDAVAAKLNN